MFVFCSLHSMSSSSVCIHILDPYMCVLDVSLSKIVEGVGFEGVGLGDTTQYLLSGDQDSEEDDMLGGIAENKLSR